MNLHNINSCDRCNAPVEELTPINIKGEDFLLCYKCYDLVLEENEW